MEQIVWSDLLIIIVTFIAMGWFFWSKIRSVNPPPDAIGAVKIFPWLVLIFIQIQFLDNLSYAECSSLDDEDRVSKLE